MKEASTASKMGGQQSNLKDVAKVGEGETDDPPTLDSFPVSYNGLEKEDRKQYTHPTQNKGQNQVQNEGASFSCIAEEALAPQLLIEKFPKKWVRLKLS